MKTDSVLIPLVLAAPGEPLVPGPTGVGDFAGVLEELAGLADLAAARLARESGPEIEAALADVSRGPSWLAPGLTTEGALRERVAADVPEQALALQADPLQLPPLVPFAPAPGVVATGLTDGSGTDVPSAEGSGQAEPIGPKVGAVRQAGPDAPGALVAAIVLPEGAPRPALPPAQAAVPVSGPRTALGATDKVPEGDRVLPDAPQTPRARELADATPLAVEAHRDAGPKRPDANATRDTPIGLTPVLAEPPPGRPANAGAGQEIAATSGAVGVGLAFRPDDPGGASSLSMSGASPSTAPTATISKPADPLAMPQWAREERVGKIAFAASDRTEAPAQAAIPAGNAALAQPAPAPWLPLAPGAVVVQSLQPEGGDAADMPAPASAPVTEATGAATQIDAAKPHAAADRIAEPSTAPDRPAMPEGLEVAWHIRNDESQRLPIPEAGQPQRSTPVPVASLGPVILAALTDASTDRLQLTLAPEELGRVQIRMQHDGDALVIAVSADRIETIDLLRRHGDQLLQDLRQSGFSGASLSFAQSGRDNDHRPMAGREPGRFANETEIPVEAGSATASRHARSGGRTLDLRV